MNPNVDHKQNLINTILLNASFIDNLGLMHGKMGISILFYHLARKYNNKIYEEYAGELIDEIYEEINPNTPVDFENGLAGIGWGIEYLVQNGFIEADTDEVLEEFDNRIFKELIYKTPQNIGLLQGITGLGIYFLKRIQNPESNDDKIPTLTSKQTLIHLIDELERQTLDNNKIIIEPSSVKNQIFNYKNAESDKKISYKQKNITQLFDLTWDYPVLIWFLTELFKQNIFNFKVEKIIHRLVEFLTFDKNLPKLNSNRLLLVLAFKKINEIKENTNITLTKLIHSHTAQVFSEEFIASINRDNLLNEQLNSNATLRYGLNGLNWIYQQLYENTQLEFYRQEALFWQEKINNYSRLDNSVQNDGIEISHKKFGILEGWAGQIFIAENYHV